MTTPYLISIDGFTNKRTKVVKYLGLVADNALIWPQHIDYISTKIARGVGILTLFWTVKEHLGLTLPFGV